MLFNLGTVVSTPGALQVCEKHSISPLSLVTRHSRGDYGDIDVQDIAANVAAIQYGNRVVSSYKLGDDKVWCITEADRSSTCLLLPSEY